jgi:Tfp pilus assembly protein PilN
MIKINLLPEEYRKKHRAPLKFTLAIVGGVTVNVLLLTWWGWLAFGIKAEIDSERTVLQTEMDGLQPQVTYHNSLDGERKRHASRADTLAQITASRISWTQKIDELVDVINSGGEGQRHFVWLDDLNVTQTFSARDGTSGELKAAGHSGSDNFAQVANFLEDVENSPFISDFHPPAPPEGTQTLVDKELVPPVVWAFPLSLTIKSPEDRKAAAAAPAKAADATERNPQ